MLNKDSISHIHNSDKIYSLVWKQKERTTVSLLLMRKIVQYYPKKLNIFLLQLSDSGLHHLDLHDSSLLWDPPPTGTDSFCLHIYAFPRERQIPSGGLIMADCEWGKQPCQPAPELHWSRSALNTISRLGHTLVVRVAQPQAIFPSAHIKLSSPTDMFSVYSAYFLDGLEVPEVSGYGRVGGTCNSKWLENKPRGCTVPDFSLQEALQGRACMLLRGRQHTTSIWVFGICVGVSGGKGGIRQPLCRQLPYESSHPKRDI